MTLELDHVIRFVDGPVDAWHGYTLEAGVRHHGQGTANRRVIFDVNYLELLWIDVPAEVEAQGLGFAPRCAGAPGACPFGVVLRGEVGAADLPRFTRYQQPDAPGFSLLLYTAALTAPAVPFVAVVEVPADDLSRRHPRGRWDEATRTHACGARAIVSATLRGDVAPLAGLAVSNVRFSDGPPGCDLELAVRDGEGITVSV